METGFCQIKQKEVINIKDGKKLGRVCDVVFTFPEGKVLGVVVPGGRGFFQPEMFIDLRCVIKIGEDTVLVEVASMSKNMPPKRRHGYLGRQEQECYSPPRGNGKSSFDEEE